MVQTEDRVVTKFLRQNKGYYAKFLKHAKNKYAAHIHTHTHTFNGPFSGTTRVSRYQKGNTNLDFTEAKRQ